MLFRKLFRMLVLGGAAIGTNAGCSTAQAQQATEKKQDGRSTMDGGTGAPQGSEAKADAGGGVEGWARLALRAHPLIVPCADVRTGAVLRTIGGGARLAVLASAACVHPRRRSTGC